MVSAFYLDYLSCTCGIEVLGAHVNARVITGCSSVGKMTSNVITRGGSHHYLRHGRLTPSRWSYLIGPCESHICILEGKTLSPTSPSKLSGINGRLISLLILFRFIFQCHGGQSKLIDPFVERIN